MKKFILLFFLFSALFVYPQSKNTVTISILYDNYCYNENMKENWGFSCFIHGTEKSILFDTGTKGKLFMKNFSEMDLTPDMVDLIFISHEHFDHIGGLSSFLEQNNDLKVYVPASFSGKSMGKIIEAGAEPVKVSEPTPICKNVFSSGELGIDIKEQSLAIETSKGLVIITGCSHPGIVKIVKAFKETTDEEIYMVLGGFHLMRDSEEEVEQIISQLKDLGVKKCGATHCTGEKQIEQFKMAFGNDYVSMGTGRIIEL